MGETHTKGTGQRQEQPSSLLHACRLPLLDLSPMGSYPVLTLASLPSEYDLATSPRIHCGRQEATAEEGRIKGTNSWALSMPEFQMDQWNCQDHSENWWIWTSLACWILKWDLLGVEGNNNCLWVLKYALLDSFLFEEKVLPVIDGNKAELFASL